MNQRMMLAVLLMLAVTMSRLEGVDAAEADPVPLDIKLPIPAFIGTPEGHGIWRSGRK